jgi:hypothetical protein
LGLLQVMNDQRVNNSSKKTEAANSKTDLTDILDFSCASLAEVLDVNSRCNWILACLESGIGTLCWIDIIREVYVAFIYTVAIRIEIIFQLLLIENTWVA